MWKRCQTHFMRNFLDATSKALHDVRAGAGHIGRTGPEDGTTLYDQVIANYGEKAPKAIAVLEQGFDDISAVLSLPNGMERLNEEIRRRERVIRIFPNRDSVVRLVGALLMEMDEKWQTGHKYLDVQ